MPPRIPGPLSSERPWLRTDDLRAAPLRHTGRLAGHFLVLDFAAPFPTYSDFLLESGFDYWSLSIEEHSPSDWPVAQLLLGGIVLAAVLAASLLTLRRPDARRSPPRSASPASSASTCSTVASTSCTRLTGTGCWWRSSSRARGGGSLRAVAGWRQLSPSSVRCSWSTTSP